MVFSHCRFHDLHSDAHLYKKKTLTFLNKEIKKHNDRMTRRWLLQSEVTNK